MREFCLKRVVLLFAACWSFVCSVPEFSLQCAKVLFAACRSFVCGVPEFLFAACWSFARSVRELSLQRVILLVVVCIYFFQFLFCLQCAGDDFLTCYLCLQGIFFLFAVFSLCESGVPCGPPYTTAQPAKSKNCYKSRSCIVFTQVY